MRAVSRNVSPAPSLSRSLAPLFVLILMAGYAANGWAKKGPTGLARSLASSMGGQKPLEVKGQTRSLLVPPTAAGEKDNISFVKRRTNFRHEIKGTAY